MRMLEALKLLFKKKEAPIVEARKERPRSIPQFSTQDLLPEEVSVKFNQAWDKTFANSIHPEIRKFHEQIVTLSKSKGMAMDAKPACDNQLNVKASFYGNDIVPNGQLSWYAAQGFIGYQLCALISQQWLVSKCCLMPAQDAVRRGYKVTINDGTDIDSEIVDAIREYDVDYHINKNLVQMIHMGRVFGIRIAMFKVDSSDPDYYEKPFNIDGVEPGSYTGISQIDPYWITPQLDAESAGDPSAINFYEPTWWTIAGKLVHKTHLVIYITEEVPDILKPSYIYGGIPIPQKIVERVYAAERTANEAPMLALTKRTDVINIDLAQATAQEVNFAARIAQWVYNRDNYGIKALGLDESMQQFDTSLSDLDAVIMTQYQLVAAASCVPSVKLLGTSPKGFNSDGSYEEASYHEYLQTLQSTALDPLLNRHHELLIKSEIAPRFGIEPFNTTVVWESLDAMTAKEMAELNKLKADTDSVLMMTGAIQGNDVRDRITMDPDSGYVGLEPLEEGMELPSMLSNTSGDDDDA